MEFAGLVVAGDGRGRSIGFPTANLALPPDLDVPQGVFSGTASWDGVAERTVVVNVGHRPTFAGTRALTIEVHVLDFDGDLYGRTLQVRLGEKLRHEQRFGSVQELTRQIAADIERVRAGAPRA